MQTTQRAADCSAAWALPFRSQERWSAECLRARAAKILRTLAR
jgi:hypothetical protein